MSASNRALKSLISINADLSSVYSRCKEKGDSESDSAEQLIDLLKSLETYTEGITEEMLVASKLGSVLGKIAKSKKISDAASKQAAALVKTWKAKVTAERASKAEASRVEKSSKEPKKSSEVNGVPEPPSTNSEYRVRLVSQNKELYKDPPQSPVLDIRVFPEKASGPSRATNGDFTFSGFSTFKPNCSPEEVLRGGAFGGTYFRPIVSAVTNLRYTGKEAVESSCHSSWVEGLDAKILLTSSVYRENVNKFRKKCGGSLGMWESSGWISETDPYGWFQWYCRFFQGRRTSDDERQIQRWNSLTGEKGRFRNQLLKKIIVAGKKVGDVSISPVVRQTLWHWGFEPTEEKMLKFKKLKGL